MVGGGLLGTRGPTVEFRVDYRVYRQQRNRRDSSAAYLPIALACCTGHTTDGLYTLSDSNIDNRVNLPLDSHLAEEAWEYFRWRGVRSVPPTLVRSLSPMHQVDGEI
jgi:hypothetical protein